MAVNAHIGHVATGAEGGAARTLSTVLSRSLGTAKRGGGAAVAYFAQDAVTQRKHRQRGVYESTGFQRGDNPRSEDVQFDLADRYRSGL